MLLGKDAEALGCEIHEPSETVAALNVCVTRPECNATEPSQTATCRRLVMGVSIQTEIPLVPQTDVET